jgi:hypothetical protein
MKNIISREELRSRGLPFMKNIISREEGSRGLISPGLPFMKFGLIPILGENQIVVSSCDSHL